MKQTTYITFANISGGEGKTFLTQNVACELARRGFHVGVIDADPQGSLTNRFGLRDDPNSPAHEAEATILEVCSSEDADLPVPQIVSEHMHVWPANEHLLEADKQHSPGWFVNLRDQLEKVDGYDFVLLDSKPEATNLLFATIVGADHVFIPISAEKGLENLGQLIKLVSRASRFGATSTIRGFIPNRTRSNTTDNREIQEELQRFEVVAPVSPSGLRLSTVAEQAQKARQGVVDYAPSHALARDIVEVTDFVLSCVGTTKEEEHEQAEHK